MHSKPPLISDGLRAKFQAIATEAAELVPPAAYANYVIIDPTTADPERILPGTAIYVGQTSELGGVDKFLGALVPSYHCGIC